MPFRATGLAAGLSCWLTTIALAQPNPGPSTVPGTPWPARDGLARVVPAGETDSEVRPDRLVGMFYFLWHGSHSYGKPTPEGPRDIARILAADPDALSKPDSPLWGPPGVPHYWGQPLYGYYRSDDPWVLRRHAQLLADAGIDMLLFDTTNAVTYRDVFLRLCEIFAELRGHGERTPQIAFMVNTEAGATAQRIFDELYAPGKFPELWFRWQGKPLLICDPEAAAPALRDFFTLRKAHWPFEMVNTERAWHWEATFPQPYGYDADPARPEQLSVSVAQNLRAADGKVTNMSRLDARGRSFHAGGQGIESGSVERGFNVEEQWARARELDPPMVLVTGWNEWIAGRFSEADGRIAFVDQYDQEFSRDIEPMQGGHADNYYCQLIANVRRYKGTPQLPRPSAAKSIRVDEDFSQWEGVGPEFVDHRLETLPRDHSGVAGLHYENHTGRNDLALMKVARDDDQVYFYAQTAEPLQPAAGPEGLWLLIDTDQDGATGWQGYDLIVNRDREQGRVFVERHAGQGWNWTRVAEVPLRSAGNQVQLAVPRAWFARDGRLRFDFKWVDNARRPGDPLDFYLSGDVAPEGRFSYRFAE